MGVAVLSVFLWWFCIYMPAVVVREREGVLSHVAVSKLCSRGFVWRCWLLVYSSRRTLR